MPATYAILGATGQIGSHILLLLLSSSSSPPPEINVLVRSRAKLESTVLRPNEATIGPPSAYQHRLHIYEGPITDGPLLADCLRGVQTAFLTVATMYNIPRTRIARDQAEAAVRALARLREGEGEKAASLTNGAGSSSSSSSSVSSVSSSTTKSRSDKNNKKNENNPRKLPLLVMISSSETEEDPFCLSMPKFVRRFLFACNYWIYTDLIAAEEYLRQPDIKSWVDCVFFKPGGIGHDAQKGHTLSFDSSHQGFVSFYDVAAGMIECGGEGKREVMTGKSVSIVANESAKFPRETPWLLFRNLMGYLFPRMYQWLS